MMQTYHVSLTRASVNNEDSEERTAITRRMLVYSHGTVRMYRLSRMVCCRSWSTEPLGNRVAKYCRKSLVSTPGKQPTSQKIHSQTQRARLKHFHHVSLTVKPGWNIQTQRRKQRNKTFFFLSTSQYYIFNKLYL